MFMELRKLNNHAAHHLCNIVFIPVALVASIQSESSASLGDSQLDSSLTTVESQSDSITDGKYCSQQH